MNYREKARENLGTLAWSLSSMAVSMANTWSERNDNKHADAATIAELTRVACLALEASREGPGS